MSFVTKRVPFFATGEKVNDGLFGRFPLNIELEGSPDANL